MIRLTSVTFVDAVTNQSTGRNDFTHRETDGLIIDFDMPVGVIWLTGKLGTLAVPWAGVRYASSDRKVKYDGYPETLPPSPMPSMPAPLQTGTIPPAPAELAQKMATVVLSPSKKKK